MRNICVLMTTYNGEKFIREQLDSLLVQTGVNLLLRIRDDGSTDKTVEIIKEYTKDPRITFIEDGIHLGPGNGFMELLYNAPECDYYAFSDQDDIWYDDKLKAAIDMIESVDEQVPVLYCSNQMIYRSGVEEGLRFDKNPITLSQTICGSPLAGCTMVFNKSLRNLLSNEKFKSSKEVINLRCHDTWVLLSALLCGKVVYDDFSHMLYRLHENNTVGIKKESLFDMLESYCKRMKRNNLNGRSKMANEALKLEMKCDDSYKRIIKDFAHCNDSFKNKIRLIKNKNVKQELSENRMLFIFKVLIGWI